ncbi:mechanosensitive ion channel domain-containing protein [Methylobacterium sp. J-077]|uniref:mechanosensitive ion channel domain-containing protein n=1 Tax=Methylobacterium sp. J-077 TaxID=2836656 RepID=UPI001FB9D260|nr:mechanosensitive ion channel domain-containing protein [Methylobacterium sp. J-077]MCJ2126899.1 mechanosensitive ion channel [Methylobacterium sp. J-077]
MRSRLFGCLLVVAAFSTFPTAPRAQTPPLGFAGPALSRDVDQHLSTIRDRSNDLLVQAVILPTATVKAATALVADEAASPAGLVARLFLLWFGGWLVERVFWRWSAPWMQRIVDSPLATARQRFVAQAQRLLFAQSLVLSFAAGACLAYLIAAPPGLAGVMALDALLAIVAARSARAIGRFLFAPGGPRLRLVALPTNAAWRAQHGVTVLALTTAAGLLWTALLRLGGSETALADAVTSLTLLLCALLCPAVVGAVVVSLPGTERRSPRPVAVALGLVPVASWLLAQAGLPGAAWAVLVLGLAPSLSLALGDAARTVAFGPNRAGTLTREERIVARAARNVALIASLLLLVEGLTGADRGLDLTMTTEVVSALLILLGTDLAWQIVRSLIDRGLAHVGGEQRADRLATVLPAVRTVVFVALLITAALSIASAFGLQIGPLLAGAGVVGLTIGFGAQALVRDIIAGFFLLLDDAFRVGETIESGNLQGQVEAFSLRSVRLRDDNGHMHTVAFGELKAVTNFSRDWAGLEIPIYVPHGVPYEVTARMIEAALAEIEADEQFNALLISSPRFLGATALSESSVRFAVLIRTVPGSQARIRSELLRRMLSNVATSSILMGTSPSVA